MRDYGAGLPTRLWSNRCGQESVTGVIIANMLMARLVAFAAGPQSDPNMQLKLSWMAFDS